MKRLFLNIQNIIETINTLSLVYFIVAIFKQIQVLGFKLFSIEFFYESAIINLFFTIWMGAYLVIQTVSSFKFSIRNIVSRKSPDSLSIYGNIKYLSRITPLIIFYSISKIISLSGSFEIEPNLVKEIGFLLLLSSYAIALVVACVLYFLVTFLVQKYFRELLIIQRNDTVEVLKHIYMGTFKVIFFRYDCTIDVHINQNREIAHFINVVNEEEVLVIDGHKYEILKENKKANTPPNILK